MALPRIDLSEKKSGAAMNEGDGSKSNQLMGPPARVSFILASLLFFPLSWTGLLIE
jgi:hypothetical protein